MTETLEKTETSNDKEFLRDFYAKKILTDKELRPYLLYIVSRILEIDIEEFKNNFEFVSFETGVTRDTKNSEADLVALANFGYLNIEINYM